MTTNQPAEQFGGTNSPACNNAKPHEHEERSWLRLTAWLGLSTIGLTQVHPTASETAIEVSAAAGLLLGLVMLGRQLLNAYVFQASRSGPLGKLLRGYRMFMQEEFPQSIPSIAAGAVVPISTALCSAPNGHVSLILVLLGVAALSVKNHCERRQYYNVLRQTRK